jgi:hypothetical protein
MDKRVILATAGSGKTYTICHELDISKRTLILAFTNQNISNIKRELLDNINITQKNEISENINVMTFDKFVYNLFILPYCPLFIKKYEKSSKTYKINGITIFNPPLSPFQQNAIDQKNIEKAFKKGEKYEIEPYRRRYIKDKYWGHYFCNRNIYCSLMTKFCIKNKNVFNEAIKNLHKFYDEIYIDEFQDFREYDYQFVNQLAKKFKNVTLVGDYYQHSVVANKNKGKPFQNGKKVHISYEQYLDDLKENKYVIDINTLKRTRRCSKQVCEFVNKKLDIPIESLELNEGLINWVDENNIKEILENNAIVKLVIRESKKYLFNAINWSYSKGDTYPTTCIILTAPYEDLDLETFVYNTPGKSRNNFYVALTRSKGDVYLLKKSLFDQVKKCYIKSKNYIL